MGSSRVVLSRSTCTWVQLVPSSTSPSTLCIIPATSWMTEKPFKCVICSTSPHCIKPNFRIFLIPLPSPPDLHLLCIGDRRGYQRSVVWPNDIRDHGRHAPHRAGVRLGSGYRPVVEPRGLRQAV